ncbi:hypothetical protein [Dyella japonica]|uniref:hypothetical protein n=1 Tax=Dyella japonica TaxID=231455 RepID=UPI00069ACF4C|nr:hypothetical protein [Dyella japonica]
MADQCIVLEEQAFAADRAWPGFSTVMPDFPATISDAMVSRRIVVVSERLAITDTATYQLAAIVREAISAADVWAPLAHPTRTLAETMRIRDTAAPANEQILREILHAADTVKTGRSAVVLDLLRAGDSPMPLANRELIVRDALRIADRVQYDRSSLVVEVLRAGDAMSVRRQAIVIEVATIGGDTDTAGRLSGQVIESLRAGEAVFTVVRHLALVVEGAAADGVGVLPATGVAWTANTDSFAASRYAAFAMNSMAVIDGKLYGAGPDGLYLLEGKSDAGAEVAASFRTGQQSGAGDSVRRGGYLYAPMSTDGDMQVRVLDVAAGQNGAHTYPFEERRAEGKTTMRAKFGKGVRSVMWQFEVSNKAGADFSVPNGLQWLTDPGSRRV